MRLQWLGLFGKSDIKYCIVAFFSNQIQILIFVMSQVCCSIASLSGNQGGLTFGSLPPTAIGASQRPTVFSLPSNNVCGISNYTHTRVVGGAPARVGQYPWIAALGYRTTPNVGLQFSCAGSLITLKHVLTTAHCVSSNL